MRLNLALSVEEAEFFRERADAESMSVSYWIVAAATAFANGAELLVAAGAGDEESVDVVAEDASGQLYLAGSEAGGSLERVTRP